MMKLKPIRNLVILLTGLSCSALLAGIALSGAARAAACTAAPSAAAFYQFMQVAHNEALGQQDVLLSAEAGTVGCRAVFELKILDSKGRVDTKVFDAEDFSLLPDTVDRQLVSDDDPFEEEWDDDVDDQGDDDDRDDDDFDDDNDDDDDSGDDDAGDDDSDDDDSDDE